MSVIGANLPQSTVCTTINKVCASGMKSVMLAAQSIQSGSLQNANDVIIAGGMESMSNVPHYLMNQRSGKPLGHGQTLDGCIHDGLWDVYNDQHMGMCGEKCSKDYSIGRDEQDNYAIESYRRAIKALDENIFMDEIQTVNIAQRRGDPLQVSEDEEPRLTKLEKIPSLRPAFDRQNGTITAANASSLNDGAAAMVLMSEESAETMGLKPLARILGYGDAEHDPVNFTTAPSLAVPVALRNAGLNASDIEYHEINEAFSVVALANMKLLNLDPSKVNVFGGAVSLGHPIGMSGGESNSFNVRLSYIHFWKYISQLSLSHYFCLLQILKWSTSTYHWNFVYNSQKQRCINWMCIYL